VSCDEKNNEINNRLIPDELITIDLNENEYKIFYISDENNLELFKNDLQNFREHLDYKDTFYINLYSYKNMYIAAMPKKFDIGMASFLTSWLEYGYTIAQNNVNSNNDLVLYRDFNLLQQDFIPVFSRDKKLVFKIDYIKGGFSRLKNNCYSYEIKDSTVKKYREIIPANFKLSEATIIEQHYILNKAKPIDPFIDTTKQRDKSINIKKNVVADKALAETRSDAFVMLRHKKLSSYYSTLTYTLVIVRLALPKQCEILVFLAELKRCMCEEKRIWCFGLTFFVTFFRQGKKRKIKTNTLPPKLPAPKHL
jgi:hypothetical protein